MTITNSEFETLKVAAKIAKKITAGGVVCLFGDLGSGKTTFTKGLAKGLGIKDGLIKSPTYTYIREYKTKKQNIYHIDLYRFDQVDELMAEEIKSYIDETGAIVIIEWAEKMGDCLTGKKIEVKMQYIDEKKRSIEITEIK